MLMRVGSSMSTSEVLINSHMTFNNPLLLHQGSLNTLLGVCQHLFILTIIGHLAAMLTLRTFNLGRKKTV